jgi:hypothetical protein
MNLVDKKTQAVEAIKNRHPSEQLVNLQVVDVYDPWHHGSLCVVEFVQEGPQSSRWTNYVYFAEGEPRVFLDSKDAFRYVARTSHESILWRVLQIGGIAGIIAIIITLTICYLAIINRSPIPEVLINALTTILGFYFGVGVSEARRKEI